VGAAGRRARSADGPGRRPRNTLAGDELTISGPDRPAPDHHHRHPPHSVRLSARILPARLTWCERHRLATLCFRCGAVQPAAAKEQARRRRSSRHPRRRFPPQTTALCGERPGDGPPLLGRAGWAGALRVPSRRAASGSRRTTLTARGAARLRGLLPSSRWSGAVNTGEGRPDRARARVPRALSLCRPARVGQRPRAAARSRPRAFRVLNEDEWMRRWNGGAMDAARAAVGPSELQTSRASSVEGAPPRPLPTGVWRAR
jgi:hypothetical protein